jgi:hypothetical protein
VPLIDTLLLVEGSAHGYPLVTYLQVIDVCARNFTIQPFLIYAHRVAEKVSLYLFRRISF